MAEAAAPAQRTGAWNGRAGTCDGGGPGDGRTVGVEEEFLLAEAGGRLAPRAGEVLAAAAAGPRLPPGVRLQRELPACQVEAATGVCTGMSELADHLRAARWALAAAARRSGLLLLSTGTPPGPVSGLRLTSGERYQRTAEIYAGAVRDYVSCGCHVHIGVPDRETAVAVVNHLRPWLPTLLALSANSPFHQGRDTGYDSWRAVLKSRFPVSGTPPYCASAAEYDAALDRLVDCGVLADRRQTFWLVRPSERFPTVELRVADAVPGTEDAVLQAALSRALVRTALTAVRQGHEARPVDDRVAAAALWSAARYGVPGTAVHPVEQRRMPATERVRELFALVAPALEQAGDLGPARAALARLLRAGTGAHRQRAAAAHDPVSRPVSCPVPGSASAGPP